MRGDESQFDLELPQVSKLSNRFILSNSRISKTLVIFLFLQIFQFFTPGNLQVLSAAVSSAPTISSATGENGYALITFSAATGATNYDYSIDQLDNKKPCQHLDNSGYSEFDQRNCLFN
jgi:hypothetical protein